MVKCSFLVQIEVDLRYTHEYKQEDPNGLKRSDIA